MKKILNTVLFILCLFWISNVNANIDLIVSPLRYELNSEPWETVTREAKLINKSENTYQIETSASDFESIDQSWTPRFVRKNELVNSVQQLANWINIDKSDFLIWPNEEIKINFEINVPEDASPWWHYGAVFFKTVWWDNQSSWSNLKINVDYWVLILLNVDWEIVDDASPWSPTIKIWWYDWTKDRSDDSNQKEDNCKILDFTNSNIDWKCFDKDFILKVTEVIRKDTNEEKEITIEENTSKPEKFNWEKNTEKTKEDFNVEINIPFENKWNTHVKPVWKITLYDENGETIKWIWRELVKDENWIIKWEKIVDYMPINDQWWNVLPKTKKLYVSEWRWFPYENYDNNWKKIISYWTPEEYYSNKNTNEVWLIFPWQRINEKLEKKKIKAWIEISYQNYQNENIEFNSAEEFDVEYKVKYIWLNPYFFLILWILFFLFIIFWIIIRKTIRKKCKKCKKSIKKNMKICPYCWTKQKNKKK